MVARRSRALGEEMFALQDSMFGAKTIRFELGRRFFDMSVRENQCYCGEGVPLKDCDGWFNLGICNFNVPFGRHNSIKYAQTFPEFPELMAAAIQRRDLQSFAERFQDR